MFRVTRNLVYIGFLILFSLGAVRAQTQNATPAPNPNPCDTKDQHHQLDFWIGEWDVTSEGKKVASSSIQRIIGGCVIYENYSQGEGFHGKSFNFYDSALNQWRQTWVDSMGNVSEFAGTLKDGAMNLEGVSHRSDGRTVMRRMILTPQNRDQVRQFSQRSLDGGKTWSVAYDFIYIRRRGQP